MKFLANETNQKKYKNMLNFVQIQLRYAGLTKNVDISSRILLTALFSDTLLRL